MSPDPATSGPESAPASRAHRPIAGNAVWRLTGTVARVLVGIVSVSVYARVLGMEQWGLLALFQAATAPLGLLELSGGTAAVKYVAEWVGRGDRCAAARVVHTTLLFNLVAGLCGFLALNAAAHWLASSVFAIPPARQALAVTGFRIASVGWVVALVSATFLGVVSAHQRYDWVAKLAAASTVASSAAGIALALSGGTIVGVLTIQTATSAVAAAVAFALAARLLPGVRALPRWDPESFRRSFSFGSWQTVAMFGGLLASWSDRYILGVRLNPAAVGFYAVALSLESQLYTTFHEIGEVLFPAVSHRQGAGDLDDARRLSLLGGWALSTVFGIFAAVLAAVGGDFLRLWISPEAAGQATTVLRVLCVAGVMGIAVTGPYYYMLGIGRTRWVAALAIVTGVVTVTTSLLLVPRHGLLGVALGALSGTLAQWVLTALAWRAEFAMHVSLREFALHVWAPPIASLSLLAGGAWGHDLASHIHSWSKLAMETAVALTVIAVAQVVVGEFLPGGRERRRHVVGSFAPVVDRLRGRDPARRR